MIAHRFQTYNGDEWLASRSTRDRRFYPLDGTLFDSEHPLSKQNIFKVLLKAYRFSIRNDSESDTSWIFRPKHNKWGLWLNSLNAIARQYVFQLFHKCIFCFKSSFLSGREEKLAICSILIPLVKSSYCSDFGSKKIGVSSNILHLNFLGTSKKLYPLPFFALFG